MNIFSLKSHQRTRILTGKLLIFYDRNQKKKRREGKDLETQKALCDMTTLVNILHAHAGTRDLWVHTGEKHELKFPHKKCFLWLRVRHENNL